MRPKLRMVKAGAVAKVWEAIMAALVEAIFVPPGNGAADGGCQGGGQSGGPARRHCGKVRPPPSRGGAPGGSCSKKKVES